MSYIRLTDGETTTFAIEESVAQRIHRHWMGDSSEDCEGAECVLCRKGNKRRTRYVLEGHDQEGDATWEMSETVYKALKKVAPVRDNLQGLVVTITRQGEGRDTAYFLSVVSGTAGIAPRDHYNPAQNEAEREAERRRKYPDHYTPEPPDATGDIKPGAVDMLVTSIRELCITAQLSAKEFVVATKEQLRKDLQREPAQMEVLYRAQLDLQAIVLDLQKPTPPVNVEEMFE